MWEKIQEYSDIFFEKYITETGEVTGIVKLTINRPEKRNAFRPETVMQLQEAMLYCQSRSDVGAIILTGAGTEAFCSGGDQKIRGDVGYKSEAGQQSLNVLELQRIIRTIPKPVIAMVAGYAIGGGHVLHVICDLTIAADNAIFGQTGPKVGSFDGGFGASFLARNVGQKKAREIWYLCRQYSAKEALEMGLVNTVVPLEDLESTTIEWCQEILQHSPTALQLLKSSFNAELDGQAGIQELAGNATMLFYQTPEAQEGKKSFVEKRKPDFSNYRK